MGCPTRSARVASAARRDARASSRCSSARTRSASISAASRPSAVPASTPRPDRGEPGLEVAHQRLVLGDPLLEQERGIERGVDVGAELIQGDVDARLRFGMARLFQLPTPSHVAAVVEPLLEVERRLPAVLGQVGDGQAGDVRLGLGDVALMRRLPVDRELGQPVGPDHVEAQIGGGPEQRTLRAPRIVAQGGVLQPLDSQGVLGGCRSGRAARARDRREAGPGSWPKSGKDELGEDPTAILQKARATRPRRARGARTARAGWRTGRSAAPSCWPRTARRRSGACCRPRRPHAAAGEARRAGSCPGGP